MKWPFEDSCSPPGRQQHGRLDCHLENALIRGAVSLVDRTHVHSDFLLPWSAKEDSVIAPSFPLQKEMATRSSILAWRIPWTEEPGRLH